MYVLEVTRGFMYETAQAFGLINQNSKPHLLWVKDIIIVESVQCTNLENVATYINLMFTHIGMQQIHYFQFALYSYLINFDQGEYA